MSLPRFSRTHFSVMTCVTLTAALMCGCIGENEEKLREIAVGSPLPTFSVTMNDGTTINSTDLSDCVTVLTFFHTSCPDCRKELPKLQKAYDHYSSAAENNNEPEVKFISIARAESEKQISEYWTAQGLTLPYSPQSDRSIYSLFASSIIPRIYIVSTDRKIAFAFSDKNMPTADEIIAAIESCRK